MHEKACMNPILWYCMAPGRNKICHGFNRLLLFVHRSGFQTATCLHAKTSPRTGVLHSRKIDVHHWRRKRGVGEGAGFPII